MVLKDVKIFIQAAKKLRDKTSKGVDAKSTPNILTCKARLYIQ